MFTLNDACLFCCVSSSGRIFIRLDPRDCINYNTHTHTPNDHCQCTCLFLSVMKHSSSSSSSFLLFDNKWETSTWLEFLILIPLEQQQRDVFCFFPTNRLIISLRAWDVVHASTSTIAWASTLLGWRDRITERRVATIQNDSSTTFGTLVRWTSAFLHPRGQGRSIDGLLLSRSIVQWRGKCHRRVSLHSTNLTRKWYEKIQIDGWHSPSLPRLRKNAHVTAGRETSRATTENRADLSDHHGSTAILRAMRIRRNHAPRSPEYVQ